MKHSTVISNLKYFVIIKKKASLLLTKKNLRIVEKFILMLLDMAIILM